MPRMMPHASSGCLTLFFTPYTLQGTRALRGVCPGSTAPGPPQPLCSVIPLSTRPRAGLTSLQGLLSEPLGFPLQQLL